MNKIFLLLPIMIFLSGCNILSDPGYENKVKNLQSCYDNAQNQEDIYECDYKGLE